MLHSSTPAVPTSKPRRRSRKSLVIRAGITVVLLCLVALGGAIAWFWAAAGAALPQLDSTRPLAGLNAPVTVVRDAHGVRPSAQLRFPTCSLPKAM